ncbi:MAG: hypothetical protein ACI4Q4_00350 [Oscillospiraceae bacterium]
MAVSEKNALGRVLLVCRAVYSEYAKGEACSTAALDSLSAALSHTNHEQRPLRDVMPALKRELKAADKPLYHRVKRFFGWFCPVIDYDFDKAQKHVPALIYGNDMICAKLAAGEADKACSMADAMKSYPGFIFGEFEALSGEQFYDLVFGYYPKLYDEPFMDEMRGLFG